MKQYWLEGSWKVEHDTSKHPAELGHLVVRLPYSGFWNPCIPINAYPHGIFDIEKALHIAYLISAAPDFYRACQGEEGEEPTPIQWVRALVADYQELLKKTPEHNEDPEATMEALIRADNFLDALEAAVNKAGVYVECPLCCGTGEVDNPDQAQVEQGLRAPMVCPDCHGMRYIRRPAKAEGGAS